MQFSIDQYIPLFALTAAIVAFGSFSYHCGMRDKKKHINEARNRQFRAHNEVISLRAQLNCLESNAETNARAVELLNDELEAANIIKRRQLEAAMQAEDAAEAYSELTAHLKNEIDTLKRLILSDSQRKTIRQSASQLLLTSQIMGAINNKESAATQRTLASRLQGIISEPAAEKEAA